MSAAEVIKLAAILLGSTLAVLVLSYWVFAPLLGKLIGNRFDKESGPLAEAEAARWKAYKETGEWPVDLPAATKRLGRIAGRMRRPLHRLKTGADK